MHALQLRLQSLVVSMKGIGLFCQGAFALPLLQTQPLRAMESEAKARSPR